MITGIYTPDIETTPFTGPSTGPKHIVLVSEGAGSHNGNVCVVNCDISGATTGSTLTVNRGTFAAGVFTLIKRLAFVTVLTGTTQSQTILKVMGKDEAVQIIVTGDANTKGHVRISGIVIAV